LAFNSSELQVTSKGITNTSPCCLQDFHLFTESFSGHLEFSFNAKSNHTNTQDKVLAIFKYVGFAR